MTDLSTPQLGYDPTNNTVRDLDQTAFDSFLHNDLATNQYGQRIVVWAKEMIESGVLEAGTPTMIIGHSAGGDTAFDLAADPHFNGLLLDVTHTVSAGYSTISKFEAIPDSTRAVALRNIWDVVTIVERKAEVADHVTSERLLIELFEDGANDALEDVNNSAERAETDLDRIGIDVNVPRSPMIDILDTTTRHVEPNGLAIEFDGSFVGAGHHPDAYIEYVDTADDQHLLELFEELDRSGFTEDAIAISVDISRPLDHHPTSSAYPS